MNLQTQHSGQIPAQVSNQSGTMLSGIPQQAGNSFASQMQNNVINHNVWSMDPEIAKMRRYMQEKIWESIIRRRKQTNEVSTKKLMDIVKRLEEGLCRAAKTKEEYLNLGTLESRLQRIIRRTPSNTSGQHFALVNSSPIGAMIPTPGFQQTENSNPVGTSSASTSLVGINNSGMAASPTVNTGSSLPIQNGSSGIFKGGLAGEYQQPSLVFSGDSRGNPIIKSSGAQIVATKMIPTPGFCNSNDNERSSVANKHILMNTGSSSGVGASAASESTSASQPIPQKQPIGGQNSLSARHMDCGNRSTLQQKSLGPSGAPSDGRLGMRGKNKPLTNSPGAREGHLEGDKFGTGVADASGSRNQYAPVTSVGPAMNNQSSDPAPTESIPKENSYLMTYNESKHQPQFRQPSHELQNRQLAPHQVGQTKTSLKIDALHQSQQSFNIVSEAKSGTRTQDHVNNLHSQVSHPTHFTNLQNVQRHGSIEEQSRVPKLLSQSSDLPNVHASPSHSSQQVQKLIHPHATAKTDFTGLADSIQRDAVLYSQRNSKSEDASPTPASFLLEQNLQDEFRQRISGRDAAQLNNLSSEEMDISRCDSSRSAEPPKTNEGVFRSQRWLLFLKHARKCSAPEGKCHDPNCSTVQMLWKHIEQCNAAQCQFPRCRASKVLIHHHMTCQDVKCPVCVPVKNFVQERKALARSHLNSGSTSSVNICSNSQDAAEIVQKSTPVTVPVKAETQGEVQRPVKRLKIVHSSQSLVSATECQLRLSSRVKDSPIENRQDTEQHRGRILIKSELTDVKLEVDGNAEQLNPIARKIEVKKGSLNAANVSCPESDPNPPSDLAKVIKAEKDIKTEKEIKSPEKEMEQPKPHNTSVLSENLPKSGKTKIQAVSMVELFTIEQVHEHIISLRQWIGQSKAKAEKNQAMGHLISENSCQLCGVERLAFEPPPMYCTPCGVRIKRNAMYYTIGSGETRHCFCIPCYNEVRSDTIMVDGAPVPKAKLDKKKNDEVTEEWWVQCDKCESWQHQICALFNGRRNDGGQAEYTCPNCYITEVERGDRELLPQSAVLGAKDLPRTNLSDHLEQRLSSKLEQERRERARVQGQNYDEVPGAEELVVRVISSVDKKLDVKPRFLEIFQDQNYPTEFPYKSKVILLFQRIEGVEVCLFGMYVQEYGHECEQPNHRRVYLSYLDSVKYFRPDIKTVTGEALRTFVYHEILIGYLQHCKLHGFTSCYIWACPPLKGEDYILYCHPEIQKTPKSDKLREWYLNMLRKATTEDIVVDLTNLYEHFFVSTGECKAKVTAARLPYFDGDYWPGAAEDIISQLQQEDKDNGKKVLPKKGVIKKGFNKRVLKASGQTDLSGNASKDLMLMHKLGETISPMKEDFIMVHLQHSCSHCCILMVSGNRWVCEQCKNFQLCDKCYDAEKIRADRERHPTNQRDKHALYPLEITRVRDDTKDGEVLESEFFDTRQAFLSLCQGNHYQYDTLRRAKHSSMMILYHLHNPTAPAFVTQCAKCRLDIEAGQVWRCETCLDYEVCNACYETNGGKDHPHKLTNQKSSDHNAQNKEARQLRVVQLRKMLDLLVHASQCRLTHCSYPNCRRVKILFRHGIGCKVRVSGGCGLCKKMWYLLQLHARACKESQCLVPRCKDLKVHLKRLQQQSDSRRRAAVMEMMRQRASEVNRNS